jgi:uncharacterized protein DUF6184
MRAVLGYTVTLGFAGIIATGCRSNTSRKTGEVSTEPSAANAPPPSAANAPPPQAPSAQQPESEPPAIGGGPAEPGPEKKPITAAGAVASLAAEECNRQVRCEKVGQDKTYKTRAECVSKVEHDKGEHINAKACPKGINEVNLNRCLHTIRKQTCSPVSLEYGEACKTADICVK